MNIKDYGFKENSIRNNMEGKIPARIIATHKERYEIVCDKGSGFAKIKRGCFYDNPNSIYPTTGDFVLIEWNENGDSMITETLKRENIYAISCKTGEGIEDIRKYFEKGKTIVFLGSSGVGKSTLVNTLYGQEIMKTSEIREDDSRGRHTTTSRNLIMLPNGAMIIDTPGMRKLGMWKVSEGLDKTFQDVEQYIGKCKFSDCTHTNEPGCKILKAIENGELSQDRFNSYIKLQNEARYNNDSESYLNEKREKFKNIAKINKTNKKKW